VSTPTRSVLTAIAVGSIVTACGIFRSGPDPVAFDPGATPIGSGWFCSVGDDDSFCEREMIDCARKREVTPEAKSCTEWKKPAYCYSFVTESTKTHVDCLATEGHCENRAKAWRNSSDSKVDPARVSVCTEVR
jgi:hypothetical protein